MRKRQKTKDDERQTTDDKKRRIFFCAKNKRTPKLESRIELLVVGIVVVLDSSCWLLGHVYIVYTA
jgi:hypothetical protein